MGEVFFLVTARGRTEPCDRWNKTAVFSGLVLGECAHVPTKHHPRSSGAQTRAQNITEIQISLEYLYHTGCFHDEEPATALIADFEALRGRLEALT